jgi:predicted SprT family Zn-dependent metalloprotease
MPIIHTYVDLNNNQEWAVVNMEANLQQMFEKMKDQYWKNLLTNVNYTIKWDTTAIISDDSSFKIFESHKQVLIHPKAMIRPRVQLVSLLLHILIHLYVSSQTKGKISLHDENFREIMHFINDSMKTQITVSAHLSAALDLLMCTSIFRQTTSSISQLKMQIIRTNGTSAQVYARAMSRSMDRFVARLYQMSLMPSGKSMKRLAAVNTFACLR